MLLTKSQLKPAQIDAVDFMYENNRGLIVAEMGFGKTAVALTAIQELLLDNVVERMLIVTTKKVAQTVWLQESRKWAHTQDLEIALAIGSDTQRLNALQSDADVIVINFENLVWLCKKQSKFMDGFDGLLIDETTKLKSSGGEGFKALRKYIDRMNWSMGLTGTPVSEDFIGLYAQMLITCGSESPLGTRKDKYLSRYFIPDYNGYNWDLREAADALIMKRIADYVFLCEGYTGQLPAISYKTLKLNMPDLLQDGYNELAKDFVLDDIEAENAAVLQGKLSQLTCGFIYDNEGKRIDLDDYRIRRFKRVVASHDAPLIVFYWWQDDCGLLKAEAESEGKTVGMIGGKASDAKLAETVEAWNRGEIDVLLLHPRSAGHGLNLAQGGCDVLWYSPTWSRDLFSQANARLWRQGQKKPVTVYEMIAVGTVDKLMQERVEDKAKFMEMFKRHVA